MKVPRAVIFDLGGTLWHWPRLDPTSDAPWFWDRSYEHLVRRLGGLNGPERRAFIGAMVAAEDEYRRRVKKEGRSQTPLGIVADGFERLEISPSEAGLSAVLEGYARAAPGHTELFSDAISTLSRLREDGYGIGVLSNTWWSSGWLNADLEGLGLAGFADAVLYTSDLPHAKPHASVFQEAAARVGAEPAACVMVGDDPVCDVAGACRAGMKTVWKRSGREDEALCGQVPDAIVKDLAEVPVLLRRWAL